jgi:hypothetical protein
MRSIYRTISILTIVNMADILTIVDTEIGRHVERTPMHAHGPNGSLVSWMITGDGGVAEDRRLRHLVALADSRAGEPSLLDRALSRLGLRAADAPAPALDWCAVA